MRIANFENAKKIKERFDKLMDQKKKITDVIDFNRTPKPEHFELFSFGTTLLDWELLDWKKMLADALDRINAEMKKLEVEFENLD